MLLLVCLYSVNHMDLMKNPERNYSPRKKNSSTKDYCRQQQRSFHQHLQYNDRQKYLNNRTSQNDSSFNTYGIEKNITRVTFIVEYQNPQTNMFP